MFEPGVVCPGIDKVRKTQLPDIPQPLERGGVEQGEGVLFHFHIAVDRVLYDFQKTTKRIFIYMG
jgi:hypothetical protein